MKKMNVLVLGGTGYLGSKVVKALLEEGHRVVVAKRASADLSRFYSVLGDTSILSPEFVSTDINDIDNCMIEIPLDLVLNMACNYGRGNTPYSQVMEANFEFPSRVFAKAVEHGISSILTIGTSLPEDVNMYSFSKSILGDFGRFLALKHNIFFGHIKLEMFYGSDEPKERFISSLIRNMLMGQEINVTLGTQLRDIISVSDVVDAILKIKSSGLSGYHEIGLGTGVAPSIRDIIGFIWKETGEKSKINYGAIPMRAGEPDCIADISVLNEICENWQPISWEEGLRKMICDIRKEG